MLESFLDLISGSPWTYAFVLVIALLDAFFPAVPSETAVIAAGVLAAGGDLFVWAVIPAAAVGAILGDNVSYGIGRTIGERISGWLFRGKRRRHLERAQRMLDERGGYLIIVARFIPGGRTAATFAAGLLRWRWRRFIVFDVVAGVFWGSYAGLLGFFGGKAFEEEPIKGFIVAFAVALLITAGIEAVRWARKRSRAAET